MVKKIFHGSSSIVETPVFGFGKPNNDYGLGFYCTEDIVLAKEWGVTKTANGYANIYNIDLDNLSILSLNSDAFTVLHWLAILLENRSFDVSSVLALEAKDYLLKYYLPNYKEYDVITGYRADDSYFSFAQDFINGAISVRQLANALRLGNLGTQFVLKSKKAFNSISFQSYEIAESNQWFAQKEYRDMSARRQYFDVERNKRNKNDLYIIQILDQEIKADDLRLR
ncbi:MAG: DUF3990 domain-containing protein [Sphaerochaetaceae bacterium]|nr:DUF3990 domain-containing protein [Sphaerochaetaceae bacterium]